MMEWEKKPNTDKTWANATTDFKEIVREQETYAKLSGRTSKKARYESAAMAREKAAREQERIQMQKPTSAMKSESTSQGSPARRILRANSYTRQNSATRSWQIKQQQ